MKSLKWNAVLHCCVQLSLALIFFPGAGPGWAFGEIPRSPPPLNSKPDPSDEIFTNGLIPRIHIEITGTNLAALQKNNRGYVRATVKEGDKVYGEVGIHVKGSAGSVRNLDDRPALTLNFDKYQDHQRFHGLDKLHMNNSVQDASYLTELLCGEMFRASNVPAARVTHARVWLNGRDLGLYVLKEGFDKTFLKLYFKNPKGSLYDGGFLREITEPLQRNTGSEAKGQPEVKALVLAANEPDPVLRLQRLEKTLDVERFLSFMAMEIMTFHWDGYCLKRNNYRVYHDLDTDKIVFFPHGMDQMFWEPNFSIQPQMEGLVARAIMTTSEGRRRYKERVATLLTNVFRVDALTNRINQVRARIRPELAAMNPNAARDHDGQVQRIRDLITQRVAGIEKQLSLPEPKPLQFDGAGLASVSGWRVQNELSNAQLDKSTDAEKKQTLHIHAGSDGRCTASWRTRVLLESGRYLFQAQVRTAGMVPLKDIKGEGAGVRISGSKEARLNSAVNETTWKKVEYEFPVPPGTDEVELVCELRAVKGDAWFDLDSLKLIRKGK